MNNNEKTFELDTFGRQHLPQQMQSQSSQVDDMPKKRRRCHRWVVRLLGGSSSSDKENAETLAGHEYTLAQQATSELPPNAHPEEERVNRLETVRAELVKHADEQAGLLKEECGSEDLFLELCRTQNRAYLKKWLQLAVYEVELFLLREYTEYTEEVERVLQTFDTWPELYHEDLDMMRLLVLMNQFTCVRLYQLIARHSNNLFHFMNQFMANTWKSLFHEHSPYEKSDLEAFIQRCAMMRICHVNPYGRYPVRLEQGAERDDAPVQYALQAMPGMEEWRRTVLPPPPQPVALTKE